VTGAPGARTPEEFFEGDDVGLQVFRAVESAVRELGDVEVTVSASQVALRRRKGFAYVWRPGRYVANDVPAVLSIALDHDLGSPRFKEVAHPAPAVWMHHLEVWTVDEVDDEVRAWLAAAHAQAS
jgi:hypothetical protein